jgi:hypothetical protein
MLLIIFGFGMLRKQTCVWFEAPRILVALRNMLIIFRIMLIISRNSATILNEGQYLWAHTHTHKLQKTTQVDNLERTANANHPALAVKHDAHLERRTGS